MVTKEVQKNQGLEFRDFDISRDRREEICMRQFEGAFPYLGYLPLHP